MQCVYALVWHPLEHQVDIRPVLATRITSPSCKMTHCLVAMGRRLMSAQQPPSQRQRPARASMKTSLSSRSHQVLFQKFPLQAVYHQLFSAFNAARDNEHMQQLSLSQTFMAQLAYSIMPSFLHAGLHDSLPEKALAIKRGFHL